MALPAKTATLESLPLEIFECILPLLCQADLARCVRVCRSWNYLLIPYLWHTIAIRSPSQVKKFLTRDAQLALLNNVEFVRELHLNYADLYERLLFTGDIFRWNIGINTPSTPDGADMAFIFNNLQSLELHPPRDRSYRQYQNVVALIRQNPGIQRLVINITVKFLNVLDLLANHLPNLQHFVHTNSWYGNLDALLTNVPESIRTLMLPGVKNNSFRFYDNEGIDIASIMKRIELTEMKPHRNLETLQVDGISEGYDCLIPFLKGCSPRLKNISGLYGAFYHNKELVTTLLDIGLQWKVLSQDTLGHVLSDAQLAEVICSSSDWTHITLDTSAVNHSVAAAIVDHCENLEVLHIIHRGNTELRGSHLQTVLSKARRLRSLKAHWLNTQNMITAADILSSEWAATSLEYIDLKIDVPRCYDTDDHEALQASRNIQRKVLRRLGQQKHLRELNISGSAQTHSMTELSNSVDCLEMTLESGLDELAGLKELEVIDVNNMFHCIGIPELEWMDKNLPKLRSIFGLWDNGKPTPDDAVQWRRTYRPDWDVYRWY